LQDWKQTLWNDIKTDQMEEGAKNFVKEVKALPKRVRGQALQAPTHMAPSA
jgi:dynein heavy chain